jgi:hypothetical protein
VVLAAVGVLVLGACRFQPASPPTLDGHVEGGRTCTPGNPIDSSGTMTCDQFTAFAATELDRDEPGHAAIRDTEVYRDPVDYTFGGFGLRAYVRLLLDDGTARVYWVQCGVGLSRNMCLTPE